MTAKTWGELYVDITDEPKTPKESLSDDELRNLDQLTKEELITLVRRLPAAGIAHALLTKEEKRERLKLKVYAIAMESDNDASVLKAANDWLDREDGKAAQSVKVEQTNLNVDVSVSRDEVNEIISNWTKKRIDG